MWPEFPVAGVLFDYGNTLALFERPAAALEAAYRSIAERIAAFGQPAVAAEILLRDVHDRVEAAYAAHQEDGALDEIDLVAEAAAAYADLGIHLAAEELDLLLRIEQEAWWEGVRLDPAAIPVLDALRSSGLRVGLCSNAPYRVQSLYDQLDHFGLRPHLDSVTFSGALGWRKPSPRIFAAALEALGVAPHQAVMVGDSVRDDIEGGHAAGLGTVLLRRDGGSDSMGADVVVHHLAEVMTVVSSQQPIIRPPRKGSRTREAAVMEFKEYLKERCRERGISLHRLALLCDLNQIYFYQSINKNKENPPPWVLRRVAPHLGTSYVELMLHAGYLTDEDLDNWHASKHGASTPAAS